MKRRTIVSVCLMASVLTILATVLPHKSSGGAVAPQLEGTWVHTVTPVGPPAPPTFQALHTYSRGGTLLESFQFDETPAPSSPGHGVWERVHGDHFAFTFVKFVYDGGGNLVGTLKVRGTLTLTGPDQYSGVSDAERRDLNGNLLFTICTRNRGTRMKLETPVFCP